MGGSGNEPRFALQPSQTVGYATHNRVNFYVHFSLLLCMVADKQLNVDP